MDTFISKHRINPQCVWFTVNRGCNFRCKWCYAQDTKYNASEEISIELAKELIFLIKGLKINRITIIGGEPTLWSKLLIFNKICIEEKIKTTLVTNAMRFGINGFWKKYQQYPNTKIGISIKAFDEKSMLSMAGISNFEISKKGLERVISFFKCGVSTVYNTVSSDYLIDIARFAKKCGAKSLSISLCTPAICSDSINSNFVVDPHKTVSDIVNFYPELEKITNGWLTFSMKLPLCLWPKDFIEKLVEKNQISTVCQLQQRSGLIFGTNGDLFVCNSLFDFPIGKYGNDFVDKNTLLEFLNSEEVVKIYDKLTSYPSQKCIKCPKYNFCGGGCPLFWSTYNPEKIIPGW